MKTWVSLTLLSLALGCQQYEIVQLRHTNDRLVIAFRIQSEFDKQINYELDALEHVNPTEENQF